jgi:hypothetical protein
MRDPRAANADGQARADGRSIYVETLIHAPIDELWRLTQTPDQHARWDLRFTEISYLPRPDPAQPQRFLYQTRIGFGLRIRGEGETVGSRDEANGTRTSALRFWSDDPRSLIREGSGYWQYVPQKDGVRFLTRYDYHTRFGRIGQVLDRLLFRPLLGWATAWSFDCLRRWLERGADPAAQRDRAAVHAMTRLTLATIWLYHGLVPKLLARDPGEIAMLQAAGVPAELETIVLALIAGAELIFGAAFLLAWRWRAIFPLTIVLMLVLGLGALITNPGVFTAAFNPFSLDLAVAALAAIGWISSRDLPSASHTRRRPPAVVDRS